MRPYFYPVLRFLLRALVLTSVELFLPSGHSPAGGQETAMATPIALAGHTVLQTTHLKITALSASPEPRIGEIVTVHTEIVSTEDEPDTTIHLFLPQGVKLIAGKNRLAA